MVASFAVHQMAASGGRAKVGWCLTVEGGGEHEEQEHYHTYVCREQRAQTVCFCKLSGRIWRFYALWRQTPAHKITSSVRDNGWYVATAIWNRAIHFILESV